jgi:two-component system, OmpR family, response regulator AdeR
MNGHKVVIVDDHADTLEILTAFVERAGGQAISVSDGSAALQLLRADRPDAVVLDCHLPGLSGLDVLRAMRSDDRLHDIPVLMYSADATPACKQQAHDLGAQEYVVKGDVMWSSLIAKVARLAGALQ